MGNEYDQTVQMNQDGNEPVLTSTQMPTIPDVVIDGELGRGGMGVVYRGRQTYLDRPVAVKVLKCGADADFVKRFQREAKILAGLAHPHIVACHHAGLTAAGEPFLVMEFVDGPNLRTWIDEHGLVPASAAVRLTRELSLALGHAHGAGIIHRDVKPENVLLARDPQAAADAPFPFIAKLTDLGLARPSVPTGDMNLTRQGQILGTPATMAPEQFDDPEQVDFRADIYGLGCVLYHALTGQAAYQGTTLQQLITSKAVGAVPRPSQALSSLPTALDAVLARMLACDRVARFASWDETTVALAAVPTAAVKRGWFKKWGWIALIGALGASVGASAAVVQHGESSRTLPVAGAVPTPVSTLIQPPIPAVSVTVPAPVPAPVPALVLAPIDLAAIRWAPPRPAWSFDLAKRLDGWALDAGAAWSAADEIDNALAGRAGLISRPLPSLPCRISGRLHLSIEEKNPSDRILVGVRGASRDLTGLAIYNLGAIFHLQLVRIAAATQAPVVVVGPGVIPPAATLDMVMVLTPTTIRVVVGGEAVGETALAEIPHDLVLVADPQGAPVAVSDLRIETVAP